MALVTSIIYSCNDLSAIGIKTDIMFIYSATINSTVLIFLALYKTNKFAELYLNMKAYYQNRNFNTGYLEKWNRRQKTATLFIVIYCLLKFFTLIYYAQSKGDYAIPCYSEFSKFVFNVHLCLCNARYLFEFSTSCVILNLISEQLNDIALSMDSTMLLYVHICKKNPTYSERNRKIKNFGVYKQFDKWSVAFTNVKKSAKLCDTVFGTQLGFMVTTITSYYIMLLYGITSFRVEHGWFPIVKSFGYVLSFIGFMLALLLLSRAGQCNQNSVENLRRKLGKFLLHSVEDPQNRKAALNLLRLVCVRNIRIRSFGFIDIDMSLLPCCVAFVSSYTVIALQFNNFG